MARTPPVTVARESERHDRTVPPRFARRHGVMASAGREAEAAVRATNVRTRIGIAEKLKATVMALSKNCTPCVAEQRAACETMRRGWKRADMVLDRWGE